jgi:hypothetical protein
VVVTDDTAGVGVGESTIDHPDQRLLVHVSS